MALRDLAERRVITMANPYRLRRRVDDAFAAARAVPARMIDTNSSLTALALVRRGLGAAIVEPVMACALELQDVVLRPLDVAIPSCSARSRRSRIPCRPASLRSTRPS